MKIVKTTKKLYNSTIADYYIKRVSKLACGKYINIPHYGTVTAYKDLRTNKRRFKLTNCKQLSGNFPAGGNLSFKLIKSNQAYNCSNK